MSGLARPVGLLMVVSEGEETIAADGLRRAIALAPDEGLALWLVRNGVPDPAWAAIESAVGRCPYTVVTQQKQPYFAIGRTIFAALGSVASAATPPRLVAKIDPDTVLISQDFFGDLLALERDEPADLYLCAVPVRRGFALNARLLADLAPLGWSRRHADGNRYGSPRGLRFRPAWHARSTSRGLARPGANWRPASGGFYAVTGRGLSSLLRAGYLAPAGPDGLEWNDDTLLPAAIAGLGGKIVDLRATPFAEGWRWMHGSRYFSAQDAALTGLRAVHPLKGGEPDWAVRKFLDGLLPHR